MKYQSLDVGIDDPVSLFTSFPRVAVLAGEVSTRAGDVLIFEQFGLDVARWEMIVTLVGHGGQLSMSQLRDQSNFLRSPSNVTQMVDTLVARGFIKRQLSPTDRRVWLVELTPEGRNLVIEVFERCKQVMEEKLRDFDIEEVRTAVRVLIKWIWQCGDAAEVGHLKLPGGPYYPD